MKALVGVLIEKLEDTLLSLAHEPAERFQWECAVRALLAVNELHDAVGAPPDAPSSPRARARAQQGDDECFVEQGSEDAPHVSAVQVVDDDSDMFQGGGSAMDDPPQPLAGQGTVLLAHWTSRARDIIFSVWDSFGTAPFRVGRTSTKRLFATCGVLMRITRDDVTLVVRTNARRQFQVCLLGAGWPEQWYASPYLAINAVPNLPLSFASWRGGGNFAQTCFSLAHSSILFNGLTHRAKFKQLSFTAEGKRLMAERADLGEDEGGSIEHSIDGRRSNQFKKAKKANNEDE